jgi:large repetitive protein
MKKIRLLVLLFFVLCGKLFSQTIAPGCATALPFCAGSNGLNFPSVTGVASVGSYSCLSTQPNPSWYFLQVSQSGPLSFLISQTTGPNGTGAGIDVDFIAWGPFVTPTCGASNLNATTQVGCSYSARPTETFTIPNAVIGQYYVVLITNFSTAVGYTTLTQTNITTPNAGTTSCDIVCPLTVAGGGVSDCRDNILTANYINSAQTGTTFTWTFNGGSIAATSGPNFVASPRSNNSTLNTLAYGAGEYCVTARSPGCSSTQAAKCATINRGVPVPFNPPINITACNNSTFDLTQNTSILLQGLPGGASNYEVRYNVNANNALTNTSPIAISRQSAYNGTEGQIIYATVMDNSSNYCIAVAQFRLNFITCAFATTNTGPKCAGSTFELSATDPGVGPVTFSWTGPNGFTANGRVVSNIPTPTGTPPFNYVCTATPSTPGSAPLTSTTVLTVNAIPVATATPVLNSICSGTTTDIPLVSNVASTSFAWTFVSTNATGASNGTVSTIAQQLTASGNSVGTVDYTITPTANGCTGIPIHSIISVKPIPVISPATSTICSGANSNITLTSVPTGASFAWTVVQTDVSGASSGSGTSIAQVLTAPGNFVGTADYTITPTLNSCVGLPVHSIVTVNPLTVITTNPIATQTICNNGTPTVLSVTATGTGTLTYQWYSNATSTTTGGTIIASATTATFTPPNSSASTVYYYCIVTGACGTATSTVSEVIVNPLTVITTNPIATQTICNNATATVLSVTASGTGTLTYQWYSNATSATTGGTIIASATTATFTPPNSPASTVYYYCVVTGACGTSTSTVSEVIVNPLTVITTNPIATQTICNNGTPTVLSVTATGTGTLTYQWYSNTTSTTTGGTLIGSATTATFTPPNSLVSTDYYYCVVTGGCDTVTSTVSEVIVNPLTVITTNPIATQTICNNGTPTVLSVTATGTGTLTYQWYSNATSTTTGGTIIASATTATFTPPNSPASTVYYYCVVTGACGTATSTVSEVIVNPLTVITTNPIATQTICNNGTPTVLSVTATGTGTLTYQWYSNTTSTTTGGTLIGSATAATFTPPNSTGGITLYYYCVVIGGCDTVTSTVSEVIVNPFLSVTSNPIATQTICNNSTATDLLFTATGTGTLTYQWYSNATSATTGGTIIASATAATFTPPNSPASTVYYYCIVTGACYTSTSTVSEVIVNPLTVITTNPIATQTICNNGTPTVLSVTATGTGTLTYQWYSNATSATTGGTIIASATTATFTPPNSPASTVYYYCVVTGGCDTVTSTVSEVIVNPLTVITTNPIATQTICNNGTPTVLSVTATGTGTLTYQWYSNATSTTTGGTIIASATTATFTPPNSPASTVYYYCIVTGACGTSTSTVSEVIVNPLTVITTNPIATQTICNNATTNILSVTATGTGTLTYQWYSNATSTTTGGTIIASATTATFTPPNSPASTVYYYCVVTGTCGTATSTVSEVIVNPLTVITTNPIATQTICNNATATVLSVTATGTGTLTYQWYSNATSATTGGTIIASATATAFTPPNSPVSTVYYYCVVTGGCDTVTSTVSELIVNPLTVITTNPIATQTICNNGTPTVLSVTATGTGTLTYQWYSNATSATTGGTIIASATTATFTPPNSSASTVYYYCVVTGGCDTVTSTVSEVIVNPLTVITTNPIATQTICNNGTPTVLSVTATGTGTLTYQWYSNATSATTGGTIIASATTATFTPPNSPVSTVYYYCVVTGGCDTVTSTVSEVIVNPLTVITTNPIATQTICNNATATVLSVTATGTGTLTYQWYSNATSATTGGTIIASATTATFTPPNSPASTVYYYCIVTGGCDTVTSTVSEVIVNPLTVITTNPIATQTICNNATATILSVTATGTGTLTYQWYSNATSATTGGTIIASATTTTFTPPNSPVSTVYYYCVVTGGCDTVTSTVLKSLSIH